MCDSVCVCVCVCMCVIIRICYTIIIIIIIIIIIALRYSQLAFPSGHLIHITLAHSHIDTPSISQHSIQHNPHPDSPSSHLHMTEYTTNLHLPCIHTIHPVLQYTKRHYQRLTYFIYSFIRCFLFFHNVS